MISMDELHRSIENNFSELRSDIKEIKNNMADLCTRTTVVEQNIDNIVQEKVDDRMVRQQGFNDKLKIISVLLGSTSIITTSLAVWNVFFSN